MIYNFMNGSKNAYMLTNYLMTVFYSSIYDIL
jgi:hypothetical protein